MRKILILFIFINVVSSISFGQNNWTKIKKNIFVDHSTILNKNTITTGWFKIIEPQQQTHRLEKYKAYCAQNIIEVQHIKFFDKNGNLSNEEINRNGIGCKYSGIVNGKLYFKTLCKN